MFYGLFSWIFSDEETMPVGKPMVTHSDLELEKSLAEEKQRELVANLRVSRFQKPDDLLSIREASSHLEQHASFMNFLTFCEKKLDGQEDYPSLQLAIEYLLSLDVDSLETDVRDDKIKRLFYIFLEHDERGALVFYLEKQDEFSEEVSLMMSVERTKRFLVTLSQKLEYEESPIAIVFLFKRYIDSVEEFAACLLVLLERGISVERILQMGLLQDFMLYNLMSLHSTDSPILKLYAMLHQFPEAEDLIELAGKSRCEERGFQCYSLTGMLRAPSELNSVEVLTIPPMFTTSPQNFDALYELFGQSFLLTSIVWHADSNHEVWRVLLQKALNKVISTQELSELINQIALMNHPKFLETLVSLLDEAILANLIDLHHGSILHLLPYKPVLCERISTMNVREYLHQVDVEHASSFELCSQFMAMFIAFRGRNRAVATLVYEKILEKILDNPQLLEDDHFLRQVRKFSGKDEVIVKKCIELETQFSTCVAQEVSSLPFARSNYHVIEDIWFQVSQQIAVLKEIAVLSSHFPHDKYALQARIAQEIYKRHGAGFILNDFIQALSIEPGLALDGINGYERILVEILTTVDDAFIRAEVIEKLEEKYLDSKEWTHRKYGAEDVFNRAVKQGNVGFLRWMLETKQLEPTHLLICLATVQAAQSDQWNVIEYFCSAVPAQFDRFLVKKILMMAIERSQFEAVKTLCQLPCSLPRRVIEQAFMLAIGCDHQPMIDFFCDELGSSPSHTIVVKGFRKAIDLGQLEMAERLASRPDNPLLQAAVENALWNAVKKDQSDIVQMLCQLKINSPGRVALEKAFKYAAVHGNCKLVDYCCSLPSYGPRLFSIEKALQLAAKSGHLDVVRYLCSLPANAPRPQAIEAAFLLAAERGQRSIVEYFCGLPDDLSPGSKAIERALQSAARTGHVQIVQFICCLKSKKPSMKAIQDAQRRASSYGHEDVVEYLHNRLPMLVPIKRKLPILSYPGTPKARLYGQALQFWGFFSEHKQPLRRSLSCNFELIDHRASPRLSN